MKSIKNLALLTLVALLLTGAPALATQKKINVSPQVYSAISLYKKQDYTGANQELNEAVAKNPNDALAQYYLALTYMQLGMKMESLQAFGHVVRLDSTGKLGKISQQVVACNAPRDDRAQGSQTDEGKRTDELCESLTGNVSQFMKSRDFMSKEAKTMMEEAQLRQLMDTINSGEEPDFSKFKLLNDASGAQPLNSEPTNEEIANAVRVLAKVGFNPFAQNINPVYSTNSSPQLAQLNAMMGQMGGASSASNNSFANLLPYLMMSQGTGDITQGSKIDPKLLQTMMLSQMVQNYGFGFDNNNRSY
ncbi:TPR repeat-containing protein [Candidatus Gastranaerophilus sp. (ex Termes propinquus)]|nr:TPR repeat-containing protein [Candidatus Gastranaerophilus sp. (ex Termes propinquus)]